MHLRQIILTPMADEGTALLQQTAKRSSPNSTAGANFGDLARKYSQDDMSRRGGDWGWIERQDIRKELSTVAFGLQARRATANPWNSAIRSSFSTAKTSARK